MSGASDQDSVPSHLGAGRVTPLPHRELPPYPDGVRYGVLGALAVQDDGGGLVRLGGPARRRLLAALLSRVGRVVPVDVLVDDLWSDTPPMTAEKTLQSHVMRLRDDLGRRGDTSPLITEPGGYRLDVDPSCVDAWCFERDLSHGRAALAEGNTASALALLDQSLSWWRGDAYAEFPDASFAVTERMRLGELRSLALDARTDAALAEGRGADLIADLETRVLIEPYRERSWEQLVVALYRTGRQADALAAYHRARTRLIDDLGLEPSANLRDLEGRILAQDPSLLPTGAVVVQLRPLEHEDEESVGSLALATEARATEINATLSRVTVVAPECPYPGLRPFDETDADLFVGRERLTAELAGRLVDNDLVVLVGASGAGKSSLLRAGLVPALRQGAIPGSAAWRITVVTPGTQPDAALAGRMGNLAIVDQFEELFTLGTKEAIHATDARLRSLLATGTRIVLSLRADFYDRLTELPSFAARIGTVTVLVGPLTEDETRRAVLEPAQRVGVTVLPAVADQVLSDVRGAAGELPLMSAALERAWQQRTGDRITLDDYFAGGGVHGALEALAEEAFDGLSTSEQNSARRILLRLSALVNGTWVRRPAQALELAPPTDDDARRALDQLLTWRLVTAGPLTVELTHEALLTRWPRLQMWLAERAAVADQLEFLGTAAITWDHDGRPPEGLLRGPRLQGASQWEAAHPDEFTPLEVEFLRSSRLAIDRELRTEQKRRRRLSVILAVVAVLAVGAALLTGVAIRERNTASTAALRAVAGKVTAESSTVNDTQVSTLLSAAAYRLADTPDTRAALLSALVKQGVALWTAKMNAKLVWVGVAPNARAAWVADDETNMWRVDTRTHTAKRVFGVPGGTVADLSPDGRYFVSCGQAWAGNQQMFVVRTSDGMVVHAITTNPAIAGQPSCGQFTRDGRWFVESSLADSIADPYANFGDQLLIYDTSHWTSPARTVATGGRVAALATSMSSAIVWRADGKLAFLDPVAGRLSSFTKRSDLTGCRPNGSCQLALSPDAKWLSYTAASNSHTSKLLSTSNLAEASTGTLGLAAPVTHLAFSPDSSRLALTAVDGSVMVLRASHNATTTFYHAGGGTGELSVAWTRAGGHLGLVSVGESSQMTAWDLTSIPAVVHASTRRTPGDDNGNFANGYYVDITSRVDPKSGIATAQFIYQDNVVTHQRISLPIPIQPGLGESVNWVWPSADGSGATVTVQDTWRRWRVYVANFARHSLKVLYPLKVHQDPVDNDSAALSFDGRLLYVASGLQDIRTIDVASGRIVRTVHIPFVNKSDNLLGATPIGADRFGRVVAFEQDIDPTTDFAAEGLIQPVRFSGSDQTLLLIDPTTGKIEGQSRQPGFPSSMTWSPDGNRLAVSATDGALSVFDAQTLRRVAPQVRETVARPITISWSPDGSMLLTSRTDGQVLLWDAATLSQLGPGAQLGHNGPVYAFYAKDGNISGFMPSTIDDPDPTRWFTMPGTPSRWLAAACASVGRDLTTAEWSRYVGDIRQIRVCPNNANH